MCPALPPAMPIEKFDCQNKCLIAPFVSWSCLLDSAFLASWSGYQPHLFSIHIVCRIKIFLTSGVYKFFFFFFHIEAHRGTSTPGIVYSYWLSQKNSIFNMLNSYYPRYSPKGTSNASRSTVRLSLVLRPLWRVGTSLRLSAMFN